MGSIQLEKEQDWNQNRQNRGNRLTDIPKNSCAYIATLDTIFGSKWSNQCNVSYQRIPNLVRFLRPNLSLFTYFKNTIKLLTIIFEMDGTLQISNNPILCIKSYYEYSNLSRIWFSSFGSKVHLNKAVKNIIHQQKTLRNKIPTQPAIYQRTLLGLNARMLGCIHKLCTSKQKEKIQIYFTTKFILFCCLLWNGPNQVVTSLIGQPKSMLEIMVRSVEHKSNYQHNGTPPDYISNIKLKVQKVKHIPQLCYSSKQSMVKNQNNTIILWAENTCEVSMAQEQFQLP